MRLVTLSNRLLISYVQNSQAKFPSLEEWNYLSIGSVQKMFVLLVQNDEKPNFVLGKISPVVPPFDWLRPKIRSVSKNHEISYFWFKIMKNLVLCIDSYVHCFPLSIDLVAANFSKTWQEKMLAGFNNYVNKLSKP